MATSWARDVGHATGNAVFVVMARRSQHCMQLCRRTIIMIMYAGTCILICHDCTALSAVILHAVGDTGYCTKVPGAAYLCPLAYGHYYYISIAE